MQKKSHVRAYIAHLSSILGSLRSIVARYLRDRALQKRIRRSVRNKAPQRRMVRWIRNKVLQKRAIGIAVLSIAVVILVTLSVVIFSRAQAEKRAAVVFMSDHYYNSFSALHIRAVFRFRAPRPRDMKVRYTFVKVDKGYAEITKKIEEHAHAGAEVFVAFEREFVAPFIDATSRFRSREFYFFTEEESLHPLRENAHAVLLPAARYDYLLGYFASLLLHYELQDAHTERTVTIISDRADDQQTHTDALYYGLQSVYAQVQNNYLTIDYPVSDKEILNIFEKLRIENTKIVILLIDRVPRVFIRAARKNNIMLISRGRRAFLRGMHIAHISLDWDALLHAHLAPHISDNSTENIVITPASAYYELRYRMRYQGREWNASLIAQFESIIESIESGEIDLNL